MFLGSAISFLLFFCVVSRDYSEYTSMYQEWSFILQPLRGRGLVSNHPKNDNTLISRQCIAKVLLYAKEALEMHLWEGQ